MTTTAMQSHQRWKSGTRFEIGLNGPKGTVIHSYDGIRCELDGNPNELYLSVRWLNRHARILSPER